MSNVRDELQRDVLEALADDATLLTITVDFARGVLAEMDEPRLLKLWEIELLHDAGWEYAFIPEARQLRAALAAALATLAEVRELRDEYRAYLDSGQNQDDPTGIGPLLSVKAAVHALTEILDRSTP
ncbi:hypothetical protein [Gordonia aichiensis]